MDLSLREGERVGAGIQRVVLACLDDALLHLSSADGAHDLHVHETRKRIKEVRALLRMLRGTLRKRDLRRTDRTLRDAARPLAMARDAVVRLETLQAVGVDTTHSPAGWAGTSSRLEEWKAAEGARLATGGPQRQAAALLTGVRRVVAGWVLDDAGWPTVSKGLRWAVRSGRARFAEVRQGPTAEIVHEWRKRVKDLWYQLRLLLPVAPELLGETISHLEELSALLGDHQDRAVLDTELTSPDPSDDSGVVAPLRHALAEQQQRLRDRAEIVGDLVYGRRPRRWLDPLEKAITDWER